MSDITKDQVIDWLSNQTVLEVADLVKELEEKWGVSAAAPVAVAAALAVVSEILENDLIAQVNKRGAFFELQLRSRFAQNLHVGDIRGRGLFWGIELVADRQSKAPFDPKLGLAGKLKKAAFAEGRICYPMPGARDGQLGDHVLLAPPFISSEDELDDAQNRLQIALEKALSSAGE